MAGQPGFFDLDERYAALSASGDPLERLARVVDFEIFRADLDRALNRSERPKGGRPPMDAVMMFKILVIQALWGLSDEQVEYQIRDRLSFMRFLGLDLAGRVPDYSTVWRFREALAEAGAIEPLFARFDAELKERGYFALGGQIVDASIVEAPKQRMTKDEKAQLKRGETPPWPAAKARHKDVDARWTIKRGRVKKKPGPELKPSERRASGLLIPAFGYKNHINVDRRHRLIRRWTVTDAAAHDGARLPEILDKDAFDSRVWADTAYRSAANERAIEKAGRRSMIHFRKPKGRPMSGPHQRANRARSKVRSAVEHVFAEQKARMGLFVRTVGLARARVKIGMANIAYNMRRLVWLNAQTAAA
ncbi:MAG TPA: IS5 family transposase [Geminicoccaceae bacterium]|jgi:transposase, IS5 family|nr:IS5 family transposase [Geminicoccaceae bacterium]